MDPQIDPTAFLTEGLKEKANACGVLVIVMSKRYLASSWCHDELEWFKQQVLNRAPTGGRVFVIRAQKTDTGLWPDFLRDERGHALPGFSFFDPEDGSPLSFELQKPTDDYFKALGGLQTWLVTRLRELRERTAKRSRAAAAPLQPTGPRLIYLHSPPGSDSARAQVDAIFKSGGIVSLTAAQPNAVGKLTDWQREANQRILMAKHCEALALLRVGDADRFLEDLLSIGVDERKRISDVRGAPMPCVVLDKIGEDLPFDVAPFGIQLIDVNQTDWHGRFCSWLEASRATSA
jgi:hypothetical protein